MTMRSEIEALCARIGADRLLVQGAGGNVSWKDGEALWIKASGTWLRDATAQDIFVPVDLPALQAALGAKQFDAAPRALKQEGLRPSIETVLHALMPQKVVVHVHAIEALAQLVRADACQAVMAAVASLPWAAVCVPYRKPGAALAQAVAEALQGQAGAQLVFLANHGVVMAADTLDEIEAMLQTLPAQLAGEVRALPAAGGPASAAIGLADGRALSPLPDAAMHALATDPSLLARVRHDWALYPDHVVFLGAQAIVCDTVAAAKALCEAGGLPADQPVFIQGVGAFSLAPLSEAKLAQLGCYVDVIVRQADGGALNRLNDGDVAELLGWDAEKYRQSLNR